MKGKYLIIILFFVVIAIGQKPADPFAEAEISNGIVKAHLYLPDVKNGYYRGSRFDWSGVISELVYNGHSYFGKWFDKYSPTLHDAIMGPVEDFYPVGYGDAKPGESFLKIGIGMVSKPDSTAYFFAKPYPLVNPGIWKVQRAGDRVTFYHELEDKKYAYVYEKTVQLESGKSVLVLSHSLKNTGLLPLETNVSDHNFFVIDKQITGKDFVVKLPFAAQGDGQRGAELGTLQGNRVIFLKDLKENENLFYAYLTGFGNTSKDYDIRIENHKTGAAVRITCDRPLSRLMFWSAQKTICPEPFIHISLQPGETFTWNITYEFYVCADGNEPG